MFSEERIAAFNKKSTSKNLLNKDKKKIDIKKKYGNFFFKKKTEQQEVIE